MEFKVPYTNNNLKNKSVIIIIINPRRACAARVIVLGLCVCVCVSSNLPPHTLESQKRDTNRFIAIRERFKKRRFL